MLLATGWEGMALMLGIQTGLVDLSPLGLVG